MLLIERPRVQRDAAFFVLSLLEVAHRTLPSAKGYQAERALAVLDQ